MKETLEYLTTGGTLSRDEAKGLLLSITRDEWEGVQIGAWLMALRMRPVSTDEILGFRDALMELCIPLETDRNAIDVCGTGGDGKDTFNISTISAFVVAGSGYRVIKHGNYAVSSNCGSSNVLEAAGYHFSNDGDKLNRELDEVGICYLHAPLFHPAMKSVGPVRRGLGIKTVFNMLGPLVNPGRPSRQLAGVYADHIVELYDAVLRQIADDHAVLHDDQGYDEISLTGSFQVASRNGVAQLTPKDLGLSPVNSSDIHGGKTVDESLSMMRNILSGKGTQQQIDVVCANAGMAIYCFNRDVDLRECVDIARDTIQSQKAWKTFEGLIELQ